MTTSPLPLPEFTDTEGASLFTSIPAATLKDLRVNGTGPAYSKIGSSVRYAYADLRDWLASHRKEGV